jgi:hypothetical protein
VRTAATINVAPHHGSADELFGRREQYVKTSMRHRRLRPDLMPDTSTAPVAPHVGTFKLEAVGDCPD